MKAMPRINAGSPVFAGFDIDEALVLPKMFGPVWGSDGRAKGGVADWSKEAWDGANYDQWMQLTGRVVGQAGILNGGVPEWNLAGFEQFYAARTTVRPSDVASLALGAAAQLVSAALALAATAVPILGWVVAIGMAIYQGVMITLRLTKKSQTARPPGQAIVFNSDDNQEMAEQLVQMSKAEDWTKIFQPPSTSGDWTMRPVTWTPGGNGQGVAFGTRNDLGRGILPGLAECVGSLSTQGGNVNYQFPNTQSNEGLTFGAEYDLTPLSTAGALTPSSRQLAILLWQQVMKPSVTMYRIDPYKLVSQWDDYYQGLRAFAETLKTEDGVKNVKVKHGKWWQFAGATWERGNNPKLPFNQAMIASTFAPYWPISSGGIQFATPENAFAYTIDTAAPIPGAPGDISWDELYAVVGSGLSYTYADLVKYVCKLHMKRSLAALQTLICAYVPEDAPLLLASDQHRKRWEDMRRLLLRHRAVHDVEVELIPPGAYRNSVVLAQRANAGLGFTTLGAHAPQRVHGQAPTVDGAPPPPMPASPGPGMPRPPRMPGFGRVSPPLASRIMFGASLAAAAAAGGVVLYDRYGRELLRRRTAIR